MNLRILCGLLMLTAGLAASSVSGSPAETEDAVNRRAFHLLEQLAVQEPVGNVLFSPYSIQQVFGMIAAGAGGKTAVEIHRALGFSPAVHAWFRDSRAALGRSSQCKALTFNGLFVDSAIKLQSTYVGAVRKNYGGQLFAVDWSRPEAVISGINKLAEEKTDGFLKDPLSPASFSPGVKLGLLNVLYFKGAWRYPFEEHNTTRQYFTLTGGKRIRVPMMEQCEHVGYIHLKAEEIHGVILPYRDSRFQFIGLMPKTSSGNIASVIKYLQEHSLTELVKRRYSGNATVIRLPKMQMTAHMSLIPALRRCGIREVFSPRADLAGMTGGNDLYIQAVQHVVKLDVNERMTEAAALTIAAAELAAVPGGEPPVYNYFYADRPFLFILRDSQSGAVLLAGLIRDPR